MKCNRSRLARKYCLIQKKDYFSILFIILTLSTIYYFHYYKHQYIKDPFNIDKKPSFLSRRHPPIQHISAFDIYCTGPILKTIQESKIFNSSKSFVDMPMKYSPNYIMKKFNTLPNHSIDNLKRFLSIHFYPPGSDLIPLGPVDFQEYPFTLQTSIKNESLRNWAFWIHSQWKLLGRKPIHSIPLNRRSLLPASRLIMIPGGRFRESYYWDTYWILQGLLKSDMYITAEGMISNLLELIDIYGFVPNGGRIYYISRSQPPLLSDMVRLLYNKNENKTFLAVATNTLIKEYQYWMTLGEHLVRIHYKNKIYYLNRYFSTNMEPRPESYNEDWITANSTTFNNHFHYQNNISKINIFSEIIAATESGWDFSSRWLLNLNQLNSMLTSEIIPVDLNVFMYRFEINLSTNYKILNDIKHSNYYLNAANKRKNAINTILYSNKDGMWKDFYLFNCTHSSIISASNYLPLWGYDLLDTTNNIRKENIFYSFLHSGLIQDGGIQSTIHFTKQQWDSPNAWAPIQDLLIEGLLSMNYPAATIVGLKLIQNWIDSNYITWKKYNCMMEKYNSFKKGKPGFGGEYPNQDGFGWSNGVILKLLVDYKY